MKKTFGIIMIVIVVLNIISWIGEFTKGKFESPMYYIFIFLLLGGGIWLVNSSNKKENPSSDSSSEPDK